MFRILLALAILGLVSVSHAATLIKVKGDQVLVDLQGDSSYAEGGRYLVMVDGKKKAIVELTKVKGQRAIGKVLKGTAFEQGTLAPLPGAGGGSSATTASRPPRRRGTKKRGDIFDSMSWGALVSYGSASQNVTSTVNNVSQSISMSGSSYGLKAFLDLPISGPLGLIGRAGFENFGVKGTSSALGDVNTSILYLDADALLRYHFLDGAFHPFPTVGMGLHYPLSKSSGVLDVGRISATTIFFIGGGFDYELNRTMYIHGTLEYGIFPPSNDVKTSLISGRVGLGWQM